MIFPYFSPGPFHTSGITGFQHTINMDGRDEFTEDSECCSNNSQEVVGHESATGRGRRRDAAGMGNIPRTEAVLVRVSPALCSVVPSVLIGLCLPP